MANAIVNNSIQDSSIKSNAPVKQQHEMFVYNATMAQESRQFHGTSQWYKNHFGIVYTDGVKWLAEQLNCYWLVDDIALHSKAFRKQESFMAVEFTSPKMCKGQLKLTDGNDHTLKTAKYAFTDLFVDAASIDNPKKETAQIGFFLVFGGDFRTHVLMLPSEY